MEKYNPHKIEEKWQKIWAQKNTTKAKDFSGKPKHYHLVEFPYPSGAGLHVGHCMGYGASDAYCRMKRMQGFNVLFPIGWDAFGLPTENYAIKTGKKPAQVTKENTNTFRRQMESLGLSFDWDHQVDTTDPDYFRWTQWIFLQLYKHAVIDGKLVPVDDDNTEIPRLAYQAEMPINWCHSCKTGLANEEVIAGKCERCDTEVVKKMQKQWMLRITKYAERLIDDLNTVDYLDKIKTQQINWIGKSTGTNIKFKIKNLNKSIEVFTTRADTLYGCTYIVIAPESSYVAGLLPQIKNLKEVEAYINVAKKKSDLERTELQKEKSGVKLEGIRAINPINNQEIDIWIADYVLASYGTGAVMSVPAHDDRDFEFAKKYNIPIKQVISPSFETTTGPDAIRPDKETRERLTINAIVKHWNDDEIFCLNWKKYNWKTFVVGGVDKDEAPIEAAKREVIEETGYQNIKSVRKVGFNVRDSFYAIHKDINRCAITECFIVELQDGQHIEPDNKEKELHSGSWIKADQVESYLTLESQKYLWDQYKNGERAFTDCGIMINSSEFNGLSSEEGKKEITDKLKKADSGEFSINYKLRDWVFSRQHYWGEPIPLIHCKKCGIVPIDEKELPLRLPDVEKYEPTNTGESPLAAIKSWVNVKCPKCGELAKRETDTMPNWAGSSWYFLRYCDPNNDTELASKDKLDYWLKQNTKNGGGVDLYNGGMEHTTLHLLYSRFWHKFLYDLRKVPTIEPYQKRIAHGIILGSDGRKMSKSFGNVINPDEIIEKFGADTTRTYIMFIGPYDQESSWSMAGVQGVYRFLNRVYLNSEKVIPNHEESKKILIKLNQTIAGVSEDLENFHLNTVVSKLMELNNTLEKEKLISTNVYEKFILLLFPVAPHIASELWSKIGKTSNLDEEKWPLYDKNYMEDDTIEIVIQINGKVRDRITIKPEISDDELKETAINSNKTKEHLRGKQIIKTVIVPKKLISIVVK